MGKSAQLGLRLSLEDAESLKRVAEDEHRSEADVARESIQMYVKRHDERKGFLESVERGWYQLKAGLGKTEEEHAQFYKDLEGEILE